jgi:hypothetical protein
LRSEEYDAGFAALMGPAPYRPLRRGTVYDRTIIWPRFGSPISCYFPSVCFIGWAAHSGPRQISKD